MRPLTPQRAVVWMTLLLAGAGCRVDDARSAQARTAHRPAPTPFRFGRAATSAEIVAWDIDVDTLGRGLPEGRGTAARGATLYGEKCAACHGLKGEGGMAGLAPPLIGREPRDGFPFGRDARLVKTVGNYWPYATTLYDYINRAMPLTAPSSLTPDDVYSLTAYLLERNGIISPDLVVDRASLPHVRMPAHGRFVRDDRTGGPEVR